MYGQSELIGIDEGPEDALGEKDQITQDMQAARRILNCVEREFQKMSPEGIEYARMRIQKMLDKP